MGTTRRFGGSGQGRLPLRGRANRVSPVAQRGNRGSAEVSVLSHLLPSNRLTPPTTLSGSLSGPLVDILTHLVEVGESLGGK